MRGKCWTSLFIPLVLLYRGANREQKRVEYIVLHFSFHVLCYIGEQIGSKNVWKLSYSAFHSTFSVTPGTEEETKTQLCKYFRLR